MEKSSLLPEQHLDLIRLMSNNSSLIEHPGVVLTVDEHGIDVMILSQSACASCHAKGACTAADMEEKIVHVPNDPGQQFKAGQAVTVIMRQTMGTRAVFLGYVLPFLLMVAVLTGFILAGFGEGAAGLSSLAALIVYYGTLYFFRKKLDSTFIFALRPSQNT